LNIKNCALKIVTPGGFVFKLQYKSGLMYLKKENFV